MNERIKELALQAGFPPHWTTDDGYLIEKWEKFAALVEAAARADEREECAKVCIQMANRCDDIRKAALEAAAEAIRARGTT